MHDHRQHCDRTADASLFHRHRVHLGKSRMGVNLGDQFFKIMGPRGLAEHGVDKVQHLRFFFLPGKTIFRHEPLLSCMKNKLIIKDEAANPGGASPGVMFFAHRPNSFFSERERKISKKKNANIAQSY